MASYTSLRHIDWPIVWESMQNPPIVLVRILIDVTCMNSSTLVTLMARALFNSTIIRFRWFVTFSIAQLQKLPPIHTDVIILRISRRHVRCLSAPDCDMSFTEKIIIENQVQDKRVLSCTVYTPQTTSNGWIAFQCKTNRFSLNWCAHVVWFKRHCLVVSDKHWHTQKDCDEPCNDSFDFHICLFNYLQKLCFFFILKFTKQLKNKITYLLRPFVYFFIFRFRLSRGNSTQTHSGHRLRCWVSLVSFNDIKVNWKLKIRHCIVKLGDKSFTAKLCRVANMRCHEVWLGMNLKFFIFPNNTYYPNNYEFLIYSMQLNGSDLMARKSKSRFKKSIDLWWCIIEWRKHERRLTIFPEHMCKSKMWKHLFNLCDNACCHRGVA